MRYILLDMKKMFKSRMVRVLLLVVAVVVIVNPISIKIMNQSYFAQVEENGYQYWLLMNRAGWGMTFFWSFLDLFPVMFTGMVFYEERRGSFYEMSVIRGDRRRYLWSKAVSVFLVAFGSIFGLLLVNLLVTNLLYSPTAPITDEYAMVMPSEQMFVYNLFQISPVLTEVAYSFLNALLIALLAVMVVGFHMIVHIPNKMYMILLTYGGVRGVNFLTGHVMRSYNEWNPYMIIQPAVSYAMSCRITWGHVAVSYGIMMAFAIVLVAIGVERNREAL